MKINKGLKKEIPMGVSQWRNHGKKYGYWEYFEKEVRKNTLKELIKEYTDNELEGKGYDFYFSIRTKINALNSLKKEKKVKASDVSY